MHEVQAQRACSELQLIGESGWRAGKARRESGSCFLRDWVRRGPGTGQSGSAGLRPEAFRGNCSPGSTAMGGGGQPVQWHPLHWVRYAMREKKCGLFILYRKVIQLDDAKTHNVVWKTHCLVFKSLSKNVHIFLFLKIYLTIYSKLLGLFEESGSCSESLHLCLVYALLVSHRKYPKAKTYPMHFCSFASTLWFAWVDTLIHFSIYLLILASRLSGVTVSL